MCGICGIFDIGGEPIEHATLERMNSVMRHRGPDGEGHYFDREVALGHRRLSIIDLDTGSQPIGNEDGKVQVVFNGEIYNFIELRTELEKYGHEFKSRSDTEVIVHAYEQWGEECVSRFNGMFAFAVWDAVERKLFVARDHLGIKPLYYLRRGDRLMFASEIKAILSCTEHSREVDTAALSELFTFRYVPSPKTLFKDIRKLPPAHVMTVSRNGIRLTRYWNSAPTGGRRGIREEEAVEEYQSLVEDAVTLQLRSDVPLGLFLSSGVDSSTLLAIMSRRSDQPIRTFTIGFEGGEATNEVEGARQVANRFGALYHHEVIGPADYVKYYERYMNDLEEPVGNESAAAFYFVSRLASEQVKVALTGQGVDEPWAGYDRYKGLKLSRWLEYVPSSVMAGMGRMASGLPGRWERLTRGLNSLGEPDMLTRFAKVHSFFSEEMKSHLYQGALKEDFLRDPCASRHALARLQSDVQGSDAVTQATYIDTRAGLPDDLLMVCDKTAMANSLEARVPYLDYRVIEFIESLPSHCKLRGLTGKYIHKKACEKWVPKNVVYRKKLGFSNPVEHWMRSQMKGFIEDCLLSSDSSMKTYFNQDYIRRILELDRAGKAQYRRHIYLLVSLELWHRKFMGN